MSNKKYPSKYSNGKSVSAAQYITEMICENKAKQDKKDLHYRFWTTPEWEKYYRNQIASAHKLLKKYSDTAIIKALKHEKSSRIYSLRAPSLEPIIKQEQSRIDQENKEISVQLKRPSSVSYSKNQNIKTNIISKLKDLE